METIEYNSIRGDAVSEIRKEIEPIKAQKLKPFLDNFESLIKSTKETYAHQPEIWKEELTKTKLLIRYWKLLENLRITNAIHNQLPWSIFGNDLTISSN